MNGYNEFNYLSDRFRAMDCIYSSLVSDVHIHVFFCLFMQSIHFLWFERWHIWERTCLRKVIDVIFKMVYCFTQRLCFRLGNESFSKGSEGKLINHYGNFLFQGIITFSDYIINHLFYPIYKGNRVVWWYIYLCKFCSLPCELRVSELHNHHKQMQRTQLPT